MHRGSSESLPTNHLHETARAERRGRARARGARRPDIDLDLPSGDRRERVIQHVYEKCNNTRGAAPEGSKAAMTANVITYRGRSAAREVGKVLGLDLQSDRVRHFARLWKEMQDLPRHLGQHSGGMVICQGRLDAVVPLENASMPGRVVVQWDKDGCADMGIVKVDLLASSSRSRS
ncbi:MAG: hypothetical protein HY048_16915 [Acidobacteria bacterium]|nr:hypothetical protein [Acidobacteriota bacterium]